VVPDAVDKPDALDPMLCCDEPETLVVWDGRLPDVNVVPVTEVDKLGTELPPVLSKILNKVQVTAFRRRARKDI
jgi:hypothetical protein